MNIERTNQVSYELYCNAFGSVKITEPAGWEDDNQSLDRQKDSKAILVKTEVDLEFFGQAAEYISTVFRSFGISEKILLSRYEKDVASLSEKWKLRYVQQLDLKTFKEDSRTGKVTIKATEGGLYDDINNRKSDDYDILTNESADGINIGGLKTYEFQPQPRGIFIESYLKDSRSNYTVQTTTYDKSNAYNVRTIPLKEVYNSDKDDVKAPIAAISSYDEVDHTLTSETAGDQDSEFDHFFSIAEQNKTIRVRMRLSFNVSDLYSRNATSETIKVALRTAEQDGGDNVLKSHETLTSLGGVSVIDAKTNRQNHTYEFDRIIEVKQGESLSFVFAAAYGNDSEDIGAGTAKTITYLNVTESWVKIEDKTDYGITTSKCLKPFDLFDRIVAKITGKTGLFRSSIFGEGGEYEHFVVDNGFWARGFPDVIINNDGEEERIQFKTSFKDAFESFSYLEPLCWFVSVEGNKQVLRIEKATYTMQNFVGVDLGDVDEIEHEASDADFFSKIELGHEGSLEYEEINGLDEPNGKSEFGTHIGENSSTYSVISKYRLDSVGYELIRRKPFVNYPKEDTPRDKDIWIHDAKKVGNIYTHNLWGDSGYTEQPKGIFAPDTAWNLRMSPMYRLRFGHGYSVKRGLYHYPERYIRHNGSNSNKNLITYPGFELKESGKIQIKDIEKPRIEPMKTSVSFKMTQRLEQQFLGTTKVKGEQVPNYFGLIRFREKGEDRYGRIEKLSGQDKVKLTMINAKL